MRHVNTRSFYQLLEDKSLWSMESSRTQKWLTGYEETLEYLRNNIAYLGVDDVNKLSKKCGHCREMVEKHSRFLN